MSEKYDLSKFLVDPNRFALDSKNSLLTDEFMTEMVVTNLPGDFNASRACDDYDDLMEDVDPDYPPHLFTVVSNHGKADLLITFRDAVEIREVEDSINTVLRNEIAKCGQDPQRCPYITTPLNENVFDIVHHYYEHGFGSPPPSFPLFR